MVGWHHPLNGHGFDCTPGVGDRQEGLACCGPWGRKESDTNERLNRIEPEKSLHSFFFLIKHMPDTVPRLKISNPESRAC